jgi:hypothetical protein
VVASSLTIEKLTGSPLKPVYWGVNVTRRSPRTASIVSHRMVVTPLSAKPQLAPMTVVVAVDKQPLGVVAVTE